MGTGAGPGLLAVRTTTKSVAPRFVIFGKEGTEKRGQTGLTPFFLMFPNTFPPLPVLPITRQRDPPH